MYAQEAMMPRHAPLPPEWRCLEGIVHYVQQVNPKEFSCSCPKCGGTVHDSGEWPDRCRLFVDDHPTLFCRKCGHIAFPDQFGAEGYTPPSPEELEKWRRERERAELERKRSAERALEHLRQERVWLKYHEALDDYARKWWEGRGVSPKLQDWWKLGWRPDWIFTVEGKDYLTDSATIPLFDLGWQPINVKHRLVAPPDTVGKYRYELTGQPQPMFIANPENDLCEQVIVVEGEIKAMVVWATLADMNTRVVGLPGTHPSKDIIAKLAEAGRIVLVMDPDAKAQAWELVKTLGKERCRVLIPNLKVDDAVLACGMGKRDLAYMLRNAIPAA